MSGESIAEIGVMGAIGAVTLMGAAAGASCAFVVGGSLSALGRHLEHKQADRDQARAERGRWETALRDVATRNARIGALRAALDSADAALPAASPSLQLPAPLTLGRQDLAEVSQWCRQIDAQLSVVEPHVLDRSTQALLRPVLAGRDLERLTAASAVVEDLSPDETAGTRHPADSDQLRTDMLRIVARLAVEVSQDERDSVAMAAARVTTAPRRTEARNRLDDLRVRVEQANATAAARRSQAIEAAGLLQPLSLADAASEPVRLALREVIAGRRSLTDRLRDQARQVATELQQAANRSYLQRSVTESLEELGYTVDEGFQTAVPKNGLLQVTRSQWNAHGIRMIMDHDKQELRAVVVRTEADGSWDEGRVDTERQTQWCSSLDKLQQILAEKGIDYRVRSLTPPAARRAPVLRVSPRGTPSTRAPQIGRELGGPST